jgi:hypothetical protein
MSKSQSGENNPSYNRKGDNALRAVKIMVWILEFYMEV